MLPGWSSASGTSPAAVTRQRTETPCSASLASPSRPRPPHGRPPPPAPAPAPARPIEEAPTRREARRDAQAVVVAVAHDQAADHAGADAPRGLPRVLALAAVGEVLDVERLGEVLPELVRRAHLQGLAVAHHAFERERVDGAGE